jgi:hypothetical protein
MSYVQGCFIIGELAAIIVLLFWVTDSLKEKP